MDKELLKRLEKFYPSGALDRPAILAQAARLQRYNEKADKFAKMSPYYQQRLRSDIESYISDYPQDTNGQILLARVLSLAGNDIKSKEVLESVLK